MLGMGVISILFLDVSTTNDQKYRRKHLQIEARKPSTHRKAMTSLAQKKFIKRIRK